MNTDNLYNQKLVTAAEAVKAIHSESRVFLGGGAAVPQVLERAMVSHAGELRNVEVVHVMTLAGDEYLAPQYVNSFRHRALFIGENARQMVQDGHADYTPIFPLRNSKFVQQWCFAA